MATEVLPATGRFDDFAEVVGTKKPDAGACWCMSEAVEHAKKHGATVGEGYPAETGGNRIDTISGYVGTTDLFEAHGFERAAETTAHAGHRVRWIMRREL